MKTSVSKKKVVFYFLVIRFAPVMGNPKLFGVKGIEYPLAEGAGSAEELSRVLGGSAREIINWSFPDNQILLF